ncbi:hypothetical protein ACUNV4_00305 [Granulosicoccus sp. 3-233]|uniref:hypothetical protein n=1 Tax=Granulosicoccus sp. 3-233 TaxID=3417969 RepID=UPI003D33A57E
MATHHASPLELVDLETWADDLKTEKSKAIVKGSGIELARLVIEAGADMHQSGYCSVEGEVVIHCLEGEIIVRTPEGSQTLRSGQLVFLDREREHALSGVQRSVVLLTIELC